MTALEPRTRRGVEADGGAAARDGIDVVGRQPRTERYRRAGGHLLQKEGAVPIATALRGVKVD